MKKIVFFVIFVSTIVASCSQSNKSDNNMQNTEEIENFKYLVDEFADIKIMRYRVPDWDKLTLQQKAYIYYLGEAAKCGRDILWDQNFKYNLAVRKTLENILETYNGDKTTKEFENFLTYAKRVFFSNGIHHHYAEDKIMPEFSSAYLQELIKNSNNAKFPFPKGQNENEFAAWISDIICNPDTYKMRQSNDKTKDILTESATNFYDCVSEAEAKSFYAAMENPKDETPISYGLNSKLIKENGKLVEKVYKIDGLYGEAISQIIFWLEKANEVAENQTQKDYTNLLIDYYKTGDLKTWDDYNVAWVQDNESLIDFVNGFIEVYGDPLGMKATWQAVVNFKDIEATKTSTIIGKNAQWFEDHSPIDPRFKKKEVKGVSAKSIIATTLGGDCFPTPPIGINLPNADWIRKDFGSKSVTITNLMTAYDKAAEESPKNISGEFVLHEAERELNKKWGSIGSALHTDLHECLGHGSGQLLSGIPSNALLENSSSLEEARADLFALYYIADQKLVDLGICPNLDVAKAEYNSYIRNGLQTQFSRIELGKDVTQAHMQARKLIATWAYEHGKNNNVIEKIIENEKTYFVVNDYDKLRNLFGQLLAEIQRIKSEGDYKAGKNLIETYSVKIDPELHKEVVERYKFLELKPYGGFLNPEIIPVEENGKIVDYKIEYKSDFVEQHLEYGKKYNFLKIHNF
jgi:dipeptidyl-peptidase-3